MKEIQKNILEVLGVNINEYFHLNSEVEVFEDRYYIDSRMVLLNSDNTKTHGVNINNILSGEYEIVKIPKEEQIILSEEELDFIKKLKTFNINYIVRDEVGELLCFVCKPEYLWGWSASGMSITIHDCSFFKFIKDKRGEPFYIGEYYE